MNPVHTATVAHSIKVYGNSKNDGFALFCAAMGTMGVLTGALLNTMGGMGLLLALPMFAVMGVLMVKGSRGWDVMRTLDATAMVATQATFPVAAAHESASAASKPAWAASSDTNAMLPKAPVPKPAIETNTSVM